MNKLIGSKCPDMKNSDISADDNLVRVMERDGVGKVDLLKYENLNNIRLKQIIKEMGKPPWAVRIIYNERFGGVLICQNPDEGNRLHYHPDADECWVIMEGEWEWFIDGVGVKKVQKDDIVLVPQNTKHLIKCIGEKPGIRFAITKPDVNHIYVKDK